MKPIVLLFVVALSLPAHADWLTIAGDANNAQNAYFQFRPDSIRVDGKLRYVDLRASQANPQLEDGQVFRSFDASAIIDCDQGTARYTTVRHFEKPNFEGVPGVRTYLEAKPVVCWMTADGRPDTLIKAACGLGKVAAASR